MKIAIMGCGHIAHRIAKGIETSTGELYAICSRDMKKAHEFAKTYNIPQAYTYEECLDDPNVDLVYIATVNPTHYDLTCQCLNHHKHVICEKPFLENQHQIHEVFELARKNHCFLMEAHKTCFTKLNQTIKKRIHEIGPIQFISAQYCADFTHEILNAVNYEKAMGGCTYDVGVYPICFANLYSESKIVEMNVEVSKYKNYDVDFESEMTLTYENGIKAELKTSWLKSEENIGIIVGTKGRIEMVNFWKNDHATIIFDHHSEIVQVEQNNDFEGEINHAIECIEHGLLESPIMSAKASMQICEVLEKMKEVREA